MTWRRFPSRKLKHLCNSVKIYFVTKWLNIVSELHFRRIFFLSEWHSHIHRDNFVYAPSQWETTLQCNVVSNWLRMGPAFTACNIETVRALALCVAETSHYNDVIIGAIASQITSLTIVYSMVYSGADQRKHESSASLAFVRGIHRGPVNSPHKWPVTRKMFPFDDVIMSNHGNDHARCGCQQYGFQQRVQFHQPRLVIRTFHRQGRCSRGGHLCNEHNEEKNSCSYNKIRPLIFISFCVDKLYECIFILMGLGERLWLLCDYLRDL